MSDHSIKGIYEIRTSCETRAIIISAANKEDPLKYDYYMVSTGSDKDFSVRRIDNPILLARNSKYYIHRINQESDTFKHYATRFAAFYNAPVQTSKRLHFKEPKFYTPKLTIRNQINNRT